MQFTDWNACLRRYCPQKCDLKNGMCLWTRVSDGLGCSNNYYINYNIKKV